MVYCVYAYTAHVKTIELRTQTTPTAPGPPSDSIANNIKCVINYMNFNKNSSCLKLDILYPRLSLEPTQLYIVN